MVSLDYAYRRLVNTLCPDFVALPQTTEEVAALVNLSDESQLQITPRGGGTSWYGGTVPNRGGVLVDMRKMNAILGLDADARTVTVEAGATWKDIGDYVESKGFALPVVPTNAIGSTIGGAINSGATGFGGVRNGSLRDAITNLDVVLPDGRILKTAPAGDAGGALANLTPLFFGAEGTLGIITRVTLRLVPKVDVTKPLAYAFPGLGPGARSLPGRPPHQAAPWRQ